MKATAHILLLLAALPCIVSCHRRPLEVGSDSARIVFDNDYSLPYRDIGTLPYHYSVLMYGRGDGTLVYDDFCGEKGGPVQGRPGSYTTFVYSYDNDVTRFDGLDDLHTLRAYTDEEAFPIKASFYSCRYALSNKVSVDGYRLMAVKGAAGFESDLVIREPNEVFAGMNGDVDIPHLTMSDGEYVIPVSNSYALSQGRLTFYGVSNTGNIASVQVFITNLARSKYIADGVPVDEPATVPFFCDEINEERIQGVFNYFGKLSDETIPNTAYIIITDLSGGRYLFVMDVTGQIRGKADNADVVLSLEFDVPDPETGGAGFDPVISDWATVWYDVPIG